jgi:DNA-binding HxlR family transcriptional regulator
MRESRINDVNCSMQLLSGKWKVRILCLMRNGPVRLGQLGRNLPNASKKVLAQNLRELVEEGIVERRDLGGNVRHVEYDFCDSVRQCMHSILDHLEELGYFYRTGVKKQSNTEFASSDS